MNAENPEAIAQKQRWVEQFVHPHDWHSALSALQALTGNMISGVLHRLSAFTTTPEGGNPAGVWVGDRLPDPGTMQQIAAEVGFSETAFVAPASGLERTIRYYSPEAEVPFCGHATIATGVVLGDSDGEGTYSLTTVVGTVQVAVRKRDGNYEASLTSVEP